MQKETEKKERSTPSSNIINWKTDPLLYDVEIQRPNNWFTANELIESNRSNDIFLNGKQTLNLYPILVKKIDFVRKNSTDRILSRFPFLVITQEEKEQIQKKILLISEFTRDYFYNSINNNIIAWKKRFSNYLERGAIPYPLFRCACEILQLQIIRKNTTSLSFESARGKRYVIPTKITPALAYLCGIVNGDGHLHTHWLRVVDETKEHIELISKLFVKLFNDSGEIFKTRNAWNVELRSSSAVRLFNFLTDQTIKGAKYDSLREPLLFKQLGEPYRSLYWRGAMDADGSFKRRISFASASKTYVLDFKQYLSSIGIKSTFYSKVKDGNYLHIPAHYKVAYTVQIGSLNPKKSADLQEFLHRKHAKAKYLGLNPDTLLSSGYFNFHLLKSLYLKGVEDYLLQYRGKRTYVEMEREFYLANGTYSGFEKGKTALPFSFFTLLVMKTSTTEELVYEILNERQDKIRYYIANSTPVKLPLQPSDVLRMLLPYLEPKSSYVSVLTQESHRKKQIEQLFDMRIESQRVNSRIVVQFLRTFCKYQTTNYLIPPSKFDEMQLKWHNELFEIV
ncbi:MAG: hypothetical protein KGD59_15655 [Candidatus Heimdallarchaeota archaeon]|nr:hypothetical protein [Candidatus Heimdallarchaeota archaeon]